ncbi:MAG: tetraacyldisaccharide 4'-kinase [Salinisphaera sp.]|uniref:tetraacyldisaccharide 4'-kinase n=1 Tax=Salinisphaera sp. TaxID=1914330 RepID=UPI003C7DBDC2
MSASRLSAAIERRWYGTHAPRLLVPLAALYGLIVAARRLAYRRGWRVAQRVERPVLVVGNISVGGSGKTPLTLAVVARARALGLRPGVVSRGYGGRAEHYPLDVRCDTSPAEGGDEPVLIAQRAGVPVVVDPDRVAAARFLIAEHGVDLVIADDGLQHYQLARDAEIAVRDARRGYGNGWLLPAGPLREPKARLACVDLECIQGAGRDFWLESGMARSLADGRVATLDTFRGTTVHAVAGIGEPDRFFDMLEAAGIDVIRHAAPDHHRYKAADLDFGDDRAVLMTEKDAVKCAVFANRALWAVPAVTRLSPDCTNEIDALLRRITPMQEHE